MPVPRPGWDAFWFVEAIFYSTRGTCDRLRTACVIVRDKQVIGAGYNGSPHGMPHCDDVDHLMIDGHCLRTLHAEANAILHADYTRLSGSTAYVLNTPCFHCAKLLVGAGVSQVFYLAPYANSHGQEQLSTLSKDSGVEFTQVDLDPQQLIDQAMARLRDKGGILALRN